MTSIVLFWRDKYNSRTHLITHSGTKSVQLCQENGQHFHSTVCGPNDVSVTFLFFASQDEKIQLTDRDRLTLVSTLPTLIWHSNYTLFVPERFRSTVLERPLISRNWNVSQNDIMFLPTYRKTSSFKSCFYSTAHVLLWTLHMQVYHNNTIFNSFTASKEFQVECFCWSRKLPIGTRFRNFFLLLEESLILTERRLVFLHDNNISY